MDYTDITGLFFFISFQVECKELFYRDLPELNDSIADKLLPGCATLEQVRRRLSIEV